MSPELLGGEEELGEAPRGYRRLALPPPGGYPSPPELDDAGAASARSLTEPESAARAELKRLRQRAAAGPPPADGGQRIAARIAELKAEIDLLARLAAHAELARTLAARADKIRELAALAPAALVHEARVAGLMSVTPGEKPASPAPPARPARHDAWWREQEQLKAERDAAIGVVRALVSGADWESACGKLRDLVRRGDRVRAEDHEKKPKQMSTITVTYVTDAELERAVRAHHGGELTE